MPVAYLKWRLRKLFGAAERVVPLPDAEALAQDLHAQITIGSAKEIDFEQYGLGPHESSALLERLGRLRAAMALNVLYARARSDLPIVPLFFSYYRLAFGREAPSLDLAGIVAALEHAARALQADGGAEAFKALESRAPSLAQRLAAFRDVRETFDQVRRTLDRTIGRAVPATRKNFDEAPILRRILTSRRPSQGARSRRASNIF